VCSARGVEHTLLAGRQAIAAVMALGGALGYTTRTEHPVGRRAAVDVSWSGAPDAKVPLFVFEVESTASAGMANNAQKVLGTPNEAMAKPLFFFHLVLAGGADNERVAALRSQWGRHNYRVYTMADGSAPQRLLWDVLEQHRRVADRISPAALADALEHSLWAGTDPRSVVAEAERLGLRGNYLRGYLLLAADDERWLLSWARRLRALAAMPEGDRQEQDDDYGSYLGRYIPGLIEHALLIHAGQIPDADGPAALERWQAGSGSGMRTIGPYLGLSQDYDYFALLVAPVHFAVASGLCSGAPASSTWLVEEMRGVLSEMGARGILARWQAPTAVWLAHVAAASLGRPAGPDASAAALGAYEAAASAIAAAGGASADDLLEPTMPVYDIDESPPLAGGPAPPDPAGLRALVVGAPVSGADRPGPLRLAVAMLTWEDWARIPAQEFVAAVHFLVPPARRRRGVGAGPRRGRSGGRA